MEKIIVSVSNDLITDQRVDKVCNSLYNNGYNILLVGCKKMYNLSPLYRNYRIVRLNLFFTRGFLFYAEFNIKLFFFLLFKKKDIVLSNDMDTLLPNFLVSRLQHKKLVFDSHELFSEIPELTDRKFIKKVWSVFEKKLLPRLENAYTVCASIAEHYKNRYKTEFKIIRNLPKASSYEKGGLNFSTDKKLIIYQGAVNIGRGLELMIDAMKHLDDYLFLIVGDGDITNELFQKSENEGLKEKVHFYGKVTPKELKKITPNAVLGISLEEDLGLNYRYALPNKIFDYIQAGIPVLCADLPEMKKVILNYNVGEIVRERNPKKVANQIKNMEKQDFSIPIAKAKKELTWRKEEVTLLHLFKNLR